MLRSLASPVPVAFALRSESPVHIRSNGRSYEVTPAWVLAQLRVGLTPRICDIIALAAAPMPPAHLYALAYALEQAEGAQ